MKTMTEQALAIFIALAFVLGCRAGESSADRKIDETKKNNGAAPTRKGNQMNKNADGRYASVNGLKMYFRNLRRRRPTDPVAWRGGRDRDVRPNPTRARQTAAGHRR